MKPHHSACRFFRTEVHAVITRSGCLKFQYAYVCVCLHLRSFMVLKAKHACVCVCMRIQSVPVMLNLQWYIPWCPAKPEMKVSPNYCLFLHLN